MTVEYDDGSSDVLSSRPIASRQLYQVKHDYELPKGVWRAAPEVFRLNPQHYVTMTEEVQVFMFKLLSDEMDKVGASLEQKKAAWRYLYDGDRAFTNGRGVERFKDFITPANLSSSEYPGLSTLICGGNVVMGEPVMAKWDTEIEPCLDVDTLRDYPSVLSDFNRDNYPYWIFYATIATTTKLSNGTYKVTRFSVPKMMGANAPVPIMAFAPVVIPMWMLKPLPLGGSIPSPYNY